MPKPINLAGELMSVTVKVDGFGRILLPKALRQLFKVKKFTVKVEKRALVLEPMETWREAWGSVPEIDMKKFAKQHEEDWRG